LELSYKRIQDQIDRLIFKLGGSEEVIKFLDFILTEDETNEKVSKYINLCTIHHFRITIEDLMAEGGKTNASRRMVAYKVHKELLHLSIRKIAKRFKRKENAIFKGLQRMDDIIEDPRLDPGCHEAFLIVKSQTQKFIQFIENDKENKK
jgi:hypothetical protein